MAQKLIRCEAGHIYDSAAHAHCPECGDIEETTCERGHVYDAASHASCPTCEQEDRARHAQPHADRTQAGSGKDAFKKQETSKKGLWIGIAAAVVIVIAGAGYFLLPVVGERDQTGAREAAEKRDTPKTKDKEVPRQQAQDEAQSPQGKPEVVETDTQILAPEGKLEKDRAEPVQKSSTEAENSEKEKAKPETRTANEVVGNELHEQQLPTNEERPKGQEQHMTGALGPEETTSTEKEDAQVQYERGLAYETGNGVTKDPNEAVTWYRKAADQGYPPAEYRLGLSYQLGRGVNRDYAEAAKWYQRSAQHGFAEAQNDLGVLYIRGEGVAKDEEIAARWYQKAAAQGFKLAQTNLGDLYATGRGLPKDEAEAVRLYTAAADQGYAPAQFKLAKAYEKGEGVRQNYEEAVKWLEAAANQGHSTAQNDLGVLYWKGQGVKRDFKAAATWFQKAAEQGFTIAQANTGDMYARGQGVEQNPYEAIKWYRAAIKNGYTMKENQLGKSGLSFKTSSDLECNGLGLELKVAASWNGQEQACTLGAAGTAVTSSGCSRAIGTWSWSSHGTVNISNNGTMNHIPGPGSFVPIGAGQWTCSGDNEIVLRWDGGQFVDRLNLNPDGTRLSGRNNLGWPVTGTRQYTQQSAAPQPPPGIMPPPQRKTRR